MNTEWCWLISEPGWILIARCPRGVNNKTLTTYQKIKFRTSGKKWTKILHWMVVPLWYNSKFGIWIFGFLVFGFFSIFNFLTKTKETLIYDPEISNFCHFSEQQCFFDHFLTNFDHKFRCWQKCFLVFIFNADIFPSIILHKKFV